MVVVPMAHPALASHPALVAAAVVVAASSPVEVEAAVVEAVASSLAAVAAVAVSPEPEVPPGQPRTQPRWLCGHSMPTAYPQP